MKTHSPRKKAVRKALLSAIHEYLLITMPVFLYVLLEAVASHDPKKFILSPEWSIATIFLAFQGGALYRKGLTRTGKKLFDSGIILIDIGLLLVIVAASINAYVSLHGNTLWATVFRLSMFAFTSMAFVLFVGAGNLSLQERGQDNGGHATFFGRSRRSN